MVAYLLGTFAVMTAVPLADQSSPAAVAEAVRLGFGGTLGDVLGLLVTLIFTGFFLLTTAVFNYSFARLLFVSGLDRRLPAALSRLNANRVPSVAVVVQSVLASLVAALIFLVAPLTLRLLRPADLTTIVYDVLQAALTVIWCVSMIFLFVDVVLIRGKYPERFARKQLAPGWVFHLCLVLGVLASAAGVLVIFTNPWVNLLSRRQWDLALLVLLLIAALGATMLYGYGYRSGRAARTGRDEPRGRAASSGRAGAASAAGAHSGADAARVAQEDRTESFALAGSLHTGGAARRALGTAGKSGTPEID